MVQAWDDVEAGDRATELAEASWPSMQQAVQHRPYTYVPTRASAPRPALSDISSAAAIKQGAPDGRALTTRPSNKFAALGPYDAEDLTKQLADIALASNSKSVSLPCATANDNAAVLNADEPSNTEA